jgi:hypothetical protein
MVGQGFEGERTNDENRGGACCKKMGCDPPLQFKNLYKILLLWLKIIIKSIIIMVVPLKIQNMEVKLRYWMRRCKVEGEETPHFVLSCCIVLSTIPTKI